MVHIKENLGIECSNYIAFLSLPIKMGKSNQQSQNLPFIPSLPGLKDKLWLPLSLWA